MSDGAHSKLVTLEIVGRIEVVYLGAAEAPGVDDQLQQIVKGLSPDREIRCTQMVPESLLGPSHHNGVQLIITISILSSAGLNCLGRERNTHHESCANTRQCGAGGALSVGGNWAGRPANLLTPEVLRLWSRSYRGAPARHRSQPPARFHTVLRRHSSLCKHSLAIYLLTPLSFLFQGRWSHK